MRHNQPNKCYPYTYYVVHKQTGVAYYGVRTSNYTKLQISPLEDLGEHYFTSLGKHSLWFKEQFKTKPYLFYFKIHQTFDTVSEALAFEKLMVSRLRNKKRWLNKSCI